MILVWKIIWSIIGIIILYKIVILVIQYREIMRLKKSDKQEDKEKYAQLISGAYTSKPAQVISKVGMAKTYVESNLDDLKDKIKKR